VSSLKVLVMSRMQ